MSFFDEAPPMGELIARKLIGYSDKHIKAWAKEWRKEVNDRLDKVNEECKTAIPTSLHWRQLHCELEHLLSMTTQITEKFELEEDLK